MILISNSRLRLEIHTKREREAAAAAAARLEADYRALAGLIDSAGISHQSTGHVGAARRVVIYYHSSDSAKVERFAMLVGRVLNCPPPAVGTNGVRAFQVKVAGQKAETLFGLLREHVRPETVERMDSVSALVQASRNRNLSTTSR